MKTKDIIETAYMLVLFFTIIVSAINKEPYILTAACSLLVVKQLGRINTTLKSKHENLSDTGLSS